MWNSVLAARIRHRALRHRRTDSELDQRIRLSGLRRGSLSSAARFLRADRDQANLTLTQQARELVQQTTFLSISACRPLWPLQETPATYPPRPAAGSTARNKV